MPPRTLIPADSEAVWRVEASATPYHWSLDQWLYSLEHDLCFGIPDSDQWAAVCALTMVLEEATLLNLAVLPQCQGRGLGRQLLEYALKEVVQKGAHHCFLEVRESNQVARQLYESMGFEDIGRRRDYYPLDKGREDALVMMCTLNSGEITA